MEKCELNGNIIRSKTDLERYIAKLGTPWNRPLGEHARKFLYNRLRGCFVHTESAQQPSKKLQEHWAEEEEKRKRFERNPLSVT